MKLRSIAENQSIEREALGQAYCHELQRLDERWADTTGQTIFDWSRRTTIKAKNWVGVIQVPGLSIEILPKIEGLSYDAARKNLLFMLAIAGELPSRERDLASLAVEQATLLDVLIVVFSERLLAELRLGLDHAYMLREENAGFVRGKLQLREHLIRNVGHKERVFVAFDEFVSDTPLNRILKRTCQVLVGRTRSHAAEHNLRAALLALDGVQDVEVSSHHFAQVQLTRISDRFEALLEFSRIVLLDGAPSPRAGERSTFSLLFPMERVFERFVARAMLRNAARLELDAGLVAVQGRGAHRWLVSDGSKGRFRLRPDIVVDGDLRPRRLIDTKWKRLLPDDRDQKNGVSQSDMYQMVSYATAYDCDDTVLVFPRVAGAEPKRYVLQVAPKPRTIRIEFIDLSKDLWTHREELVADLQRVVGAASSRGDQQDHAARFDESPGHG